MLFHQLKNLAGVASGSNRVISRAKTSGHWSGQLAFLWQGVQPENHLDHPPDPPRTLMVTGAPLMAFCKTLCTRAPLPVCSLLLSSSNCPRLAAVASPGPKTGQNSKGAGSVDDELR
jgi:hypothetical protein